jgi:coiled-coil domain-containing protein 6
MFSCVIIDREKIRAVVIEEKALREENVRLQRRLMREVEKREAISRQLSESESSLEMEDERMFNERYRHASSPTPYSPSPTRRSLSPACKYIRSLL